MKKQRQIEVKMTATMMKGILKQAMRFFVYVFVDDVVSYVAVVVFYSTGTNNFAIIV